MLQKEERVCASLTKIQVCWIGVWELKGLIQPGLKAFCSAG